LESEALTRTILVTGATGFVGTHLLRVLDTPENRLFGTSFPESPVPLELSCPNELCRLDIRQAEAVSDLVSRIQPDWIFHLAAVSNVGHTWARRSETLETNLLGTLNVLDAVRTSAPGARILFTSSSNVYAEDVAQERSLRETDMVRPLSPYAYSKISGELLCNFYQEVEGLDIVISRAFPHTGPGQSPDFVCSDWARQVIRIEKGQQNPEIQVGNLAVYRDFCDVRDVVRAYTLLMERGRSGEIYNVSSGEVVALKQILEHLLALIENPPRIRVDPKKLRKTDIIRLCGDNRKIRDATGWEPVIPLRQTLEDLASYWRREL
jgi:GDP-4-dehydro-6-deoxy-D-mannose reductase